MRAGLARSRHVAWTQRRGLPSRQWCHPKVRSCFVLACAHAQQLSQPSPPSDAFQPYPHITSLSCTAAGGHSDAHVKFALEDVEGDEEGEHAEERERSKSRGVLNTMIPPKLKKVGVSDCVCVAKNVTHFEENFASLFLPPKHTTRAPCRRTPPPSQLTAAQPQPATSNPTHLRPVGNRLSYPIRRRIQRRVRAPSRQRHRLRQRQQQTKNRSPSRYQQRQLSSLRRPRKLPHRLRHLPLPLPPPTTQRQQTVLS